MAVNLGSLFTYTALGVNIQEGFHFKLAFYTKDNDGI